MTRLTERAVPALVEPAVALRAQGRRGELEDLVARSPGSPLFADQRDGVDGRRTAIEDRVDAGVAQLRAVRSVLTWVLSGSDRVAADLRDAAPGDPAPGRTCRPTWRTTCSRLPGCSPSDTARCRVLPAGGRTVVEWAVALGPDRNIRHRDGVGRAVIDVEEGTR